MRYIFLINMTIEKARILVPQQNNWIDLIECNTDNDFDFMFHIEIIFSQECFRACYPRDLKIAWNKHKMDLSFDNIDSIISFMIWHHTWQYSAWQMTSQQSRGSCKPEPWLSKCKPELKLSNCKPGLYQNVIFDKYIYRFLNVQAVEVIMGSIVLAQ